MTDVKDSQFQKEVIERSSSVPVVVDFWASWCGPCMMLKPTLEKLAGEYSGKFFLAKVNVDEERENAMKYGVSSIPSVKMFKDGKVADEFVGAMAEKHVREWLEKNL
jgi:putative thioredoxin